METKKLIKGNIVLINLLVLLISISCDKDIDDNTAIRTKNVVDIDTTGATFVAEILNSNENLYYGFAWDLFHNPDTIHSLYIREKIEHDGLIEKRINFGLLSNAEYYVRAFIMTGDVVLYGNEITFHSEGSNPPVIDSISPAFGSAGDTIIIYGKYFSPIPGDNILKLGSRDLLIADAYENHLIAVIPEYSYTAEILISLTIAGRKTVYSKKFRLLGPLIEEISASHLVSNDTLFVYGEFSEDDQINSVANIGTYTCTILNHSTNEIAIEVSPEIPSGSYKIQIEEAGIGYIYPQEIQITNIAWLNGWYLYDDYYPLGERYEPVCFTINDKIYAGLGRKNDYIYADGLDLWEFDYQNNKWTRKKDFPVKATNYPLYFAIGEKGYVACFNSADLWEYSPGTDAWNKKLTLPKVFNWNRVFVINDKAYIIDLGSGRMWEFDNILNQCSSRSRFPDTIARYPVSFTSNGRGYIGFGEDDYRYSTDGSDDFWEFDPLTDTWTQKNNSPFTTRRGMGFNIEDNGAVYTGQGTNYGTAKGENEIWMYEQETDAWMHVTDFAGYPRSHCLIFSVCNKIFLGYGVHVDFIDSYDFDDHYVISDLIFLSDSWFYDLDKYILYLIMN